jgi:hypothetical protein
MYRFAVKLTGAVRTVEKLKAVLPEPWSFKYKITRKDGAQVAVCEAPDDRDASQHELEHGLTQALGHADFELLQKEEGAARNQAEEAALEKIKRGLGGRNRHKT